MTDLDCADDRVETLSDVMSAHSFASSTAICTDMQTSARVRLIQSFLPPPSMHTERPDCLREQITSPIWAASVRLDDACYTAVMKLDSDIWANSGFVRLVARFQCLGRDMYVVANLRGDSRTVTCQDLNPRGRAVGGC